ncbi:MAG: hypothetical protein JWM64_192 [Frankiales bacterium]|nr:hypothetical protein [Frankiales bacterium]
MTAWQTAPAAPRLGAPRPTPWRPVDAVVLVVLLGLALLCDAVAYLGVSGTADVQVQLRWLAGGVAALVLSVSGVCGWLITGLREVRLAQRAVVPLRVVVAPPAATTVATQAGADLVAAPAMTRYHLSSCALVAGKSASPAPLPAHLEAGRRPCGVCDPA